MALESLVAKLKRENASLKSKLKNAPTQALQSLRAEVQETKEIVTAIRARMK
jgi:hypothetical protein